MILFFWLIPLTVCLTTIPLLVPLPLSISDLYRKISPSSCSSPSHALGTTRHPSLPPIPSVHVMLQYLSDASRTRESFVYGPRMYTGTPFPDHLPLPAHLRPPPAFWNLSRVICSCTIVGTLVAHVQAILIGRRAKPQPASMQSPPTTVETIKYRLRNGSDHSIATLNTPEIDVISPRLALIYRSNPADPLADANLGINLADVWSDAKRVRSHLWFKSPSSATGGVGIGLEKECLAGIRMSYMLAPDLLKFSFYAEVQDVQPRLHKACAWALRQCITYLELEQTMGKLGFLSFIPNASESSPSAPNSENLEKYPCLNQLNLENARRKLIGYLLDTTIDRPEESIFHFEALIRNDSAAPHWWETGSELSPWLTDPLTFARYGEALARSGLDDRMAARALKLTLRHQHCLSCLTHTPEHTRYGTAACSETVFTTRVYLARVLRRMGQVDEAVSQEQVCIDWLQSKPFVLANKTLQILLPRQDIANESNSILSALGGPSWFQTRLPTLRDDEKLCPMLSARRDYVDALNTDDPQRAQKLDDFNAWVMMPDRSRIRAFTDALGLRRDIERGRTWILFLQVTYDQHIQGKKRKFRIDACSAFRISDVVEIMSMIMRMSEQDVQTCIDQRLARVDPTSATLQSPPNS
ncbi:uncharacterized protein STEHIDRAFT_160147 [Stereum hirsutum FP-91666 SS1]|uniref:uncharacterized protein n=1 Tax=Stereum hirsutum (strain FP-91666) TaxID=721885 RepID=UPI000444A1B9|nr:uncharacterized protein STEHIDRAFT_160147 [Stereum hirsutum FP-91666 SS1]EIM83569.1 hypothetical protein STEHIDRAFT_160147 [Stereum hirsutum FP-91666 SS1]